MTHNKSFLIATVLCGMLLAPATAPHAAEFSVQPMSDLIVVRVYYEEIDNIRLLRDFDLWEFRDKVEDYVLINADIDELARVRALGFRAVIDVARTAELNPPRETTEAGGGIPGFPCYRTVEETYVTCAADGRSDHPHAGRVDRRGRQLGEGDQWILAATT